MGYTHYWTQKRDINPIAWKRVIADVKKIIAESDVQLALEYDEPKRRPQIDKDTIRFNGVEDDGHETFIINRVIPKRLPRYEGDDPAWSFCKTAQKPYDVVVTAVLAYLASMTDAFDVNSDGEPSDWEAGIKLAIEATGRAVGLPEQVTDALA